MPSEGAREGLSVHMKKPSFSGKFAIGLPCQSGDCHLCCSFPVVMYSVGVLKLWQHTDQCVLRCRNATCTSWASACTGQGAASGTRGYQGRPRSLRLWKLQNLVSLGTPCMPQHTQARAEGATAGVWTGDSPSSQAWQGMLGTRRL